MLLREHTITQTYLKSELQQESLGLIHNIHSADGYQDYVWH